ncbi:MAG: twin-arginine translocase TatA/TatE family subunit [Lachnospiraceae bacterium]|nr:twin-arginine translocase TatA/TatE family subunit [Robinsoniella sp.]MDY3765935.1 twin-arginine translocase TatA/TatE family subunit [Lachnospiraceae bacterium]
MKLGTTELIIILLIIVVLFGPTQIPKLSRMFGKSVKNFQKGMSEETNSENNSDTSEHTSQQ